MPTYSAVCNCCGKSQSYVRKIADRNDTPICCNEQTQRQIDSPQISAMVWTGHKGLHMTDGKWIESGTDFKKYARDKNLIPAHEGYQEAERAVAYREAEADRKLDKAVESAIIQHTS